MSSAGLNAIFQLCALTEVHCHILCSTNSAEASSSFNVEQCSALCNWRSVQVCSYCATVNHSKTQIMCAAVQKQVQASMWKNVQTAPGCRAAQNATAQCVSTNSQSLKVSSFQGLEVSLTLCIDTIEAMWINCINLKHGRSGSAGSGGFFHYGDGDVCVGMVVLLVLIVLAAVVVLVVAVFELP